MTAKREKSEKHAGKGQRQNRQPKSSSPENKRQVEGGGQKHTEKDGCRIGSQSSLPENEWQAEGSTGLNPHKNQQMP